MRDIPIAHFLLRRSGIEIRRTPQGNQAAAEMRAGISSGPHRAVSRWRFFRKAHLSKGTGP